MFGQRLLSGIILVIVAIGSVVLGGNILLSVIFAISEIGLFEFYRVFKIERSVPAVIGYVTTCIFYMNFFLHGFIDMIFLFLLLMIVLMFVMVFQYPKYETTQLMVVFFGFFYVSVMLSYVYQIRTLQNGVFLTFLIFLCSWGCDTCAYCVGVLCGKHKMSPKLSPKKSVEGAIGGVVGAALLTVIYCFCFKNQIHLETYKIGILAGVVAIAALISMVGDLMASAIKRNYDIKDYGKLIPGHGGILDRFDSMIITAPIIYYFATFLV